MARTFVQQSQISGSLEFNDTLAAGEGLAYKQTVVGDLDALRSQINKIIGGTRWYDALDGSQDLADIYAAVHMTGADAAFQGALSAAGVADFDSDVYMAADLYASGTLTVAQAATLSNGLTVNGAAADFNADVTANKISIDGHTAGNLYLVGATGEIAEEADLSYSAGKLSVAGDLDIAGVADFDSAVFMAGDLGVSGSLAVAGVADFAAAVYMASDLGVSGSLDVAGPAVMSDGLTVSGDRLEVTGSMGVTEAVDFDSTLNVDGVADFQAAVFMADDLGVSGSLVVGGSADFNGGITADAVSIDGDVAKRLYIVDEDGSIKDEEKLWFDQSKFYVTGSVEMSEDLEVKGGDITLSNSMSISSATAGTLLLTGDVVEASGDLKVAGNTIKSSTADALELSGADVEVKGDLQVSGNDIKDSAAELVLTFKTLDSVDHSVEVANNMEVKGDMLRAVSGSFSGDLTVAGDLTIQGSMTYIDTENLKVKDALIHLNVNGNSDISPRGIVLHGDQSYDDLALGAKPGSGDFVLAKEVSDADVDAGNSDVFAAAKLAAMWMGEIKLGGIEGSLSGSLAATAAGAELSSTAELTVEAASDLLLAANGETAISFIEEDEYDVWSANFPSMSLVGSINELFDMIGGGSAAKGDLSSANVAAGVLTFSSVGTLTAAEHKLIDIYLNGVLLSPSRDLSSLTTTTVALEAGIASGLMADDVITVVIRSAEQP